MTFNELTLSDLERLVRAVQASRPEDPDVVRVVVGHMATDPTLRHGRITVESVLNMLDAWNGSTVPPETVQPAAVATATPNIVTTADLRTYEEVRQLLGNDLITPEDIRREVGLPYTRQQMQALAHSLPSADILQWCTDRHYFLVAGPHVILTVSEVCDVFAELFEENAGTKCNTLISRQPPTVDLRWIAIGLRQRPLYQGKAYSLQQKLLHPEYERVATLAEAAWTAALIKKIRNINIEGGFRTQTMSQGYTLGLLRDNVPIKIANTTPDQKYPNIGLAIVCRLE